MTATILLYSRPGCHLCDEMKAVLAQASRQARFSVSEIDIDSDPALARLYGESIPVLAINGKVAFKARMTLESFLEKFRRLAAPQGDVDA